MIRIGDIGHVSSGEADIFREKWISPHYTSAEAQPQHMRDSLRLHLDNLMGKGPNKFSRQEFFKVLTILETITGFVQWLTNNLKNIRAIDLRIQSPIVYSKNEKFMSAFSKEASLWFSPKASMHHYLSSAKKYFEEAQKDQVKLKRIFYCLRCTLASSWIASYQTIPPMEIKKLLPLLKDSALEEYILDLISLKAKEGESYTHPNHPKLQKYLRDTM